MIDLLTGLPGNSKTLFALKNVSDRAKSENRQVYYSGIPFTQLGKDVLGWIEVDPIKWAECPPDSIVVIDEAQRIFRNRSINTTPPKYVSDLETHRHLGIDLVFITQMPKLIDPGVRALVGRHRHMVRIMGMEASTVHQWTEVRDDCNKGARRRDSEKTKWLFDKTFYPYYKSAEVHTMKRMIPKRIWLVLLVPLAIGVAVYAVSRLVKKPPVPTQLSEGQITQALQGQGGQIQRAAIDPLADAKQYVFQQTPRIEGVLFTAPKYDELTKPSAVPMPVACVDSSKRCQCYTQQGTKIETPKNMCIDIAHNGYFQEFNPNGREQNQPRTTTAQIRPDSQVAYNAPPSVEKPTSAATSHGFGILGRVDGVRSP